MKDLAQVLFSLPTEAAESVSSLLADEGAGVELRDQETSDSIADGTTELVVWVPASEVQRRVAQVEKLLGSLEELGTRVQPWTWHSEEVDPSTWEEAYKKYFKASPIGRHFVVKPSWESCAPTAGQFVIELDPGMAFGTGLHASTRLVVRAIERLAHQGVAPQSILDIGTGTGILSIVAAHLWPAAWITAIDNDSTAVGVCRENVAHNGFEGRIRVEHCGATEATGSYNLVLANLSQEVLTAVQPAMRKLLAPHGLLIVSGLTAPQANPVARQYCQDLSMEPEYSEELDGWRALLLVAQS